MTGVRRFVASAGTLAAAGVQARFSRAKAKLIPVTGQTVEIDAGGLQLGGGLRLYF